MAMLILMTPTGLTTQVPVSEPGMTIGRAEHHHVVQASPRVCRFYAQLATMGPDVRLCELGTPNGTFVNGRRVMAHTLLNGGSLYLAGYWMRFLAPEQELIGDESVRLMSERGGLA